MRAGIWSAACGAIALGATAAVLAQAPPSSQASPQSTAARTITVSGCVQRAQQMGTTGTSGTTTSGTTTPSASDIKFVLTNASLSATGATGTSGTTAPATTSIASEYKLDTTESTLTPHVGHKVEVTGTVEAMSRPEQKPPASAANAPTLKVNNVKMVSTTCP
jgi:hypothetical protein